MSRSTSATGIDHASQEGSLFKLKRLPTQDESAVNAGAEGYIRDARLKSFLNKRLIPGFDDAIILRK